MATAARKPHATKQVRRTLSLVNPVERALKAASGLRRFQLVDELVDQRDDLIVGPGVLFEDLLDAAAQHAAILVR
jgi:hypothetical protein